MSGTNSNEAPDEFHEALSMPRLRRIGAALAGAYNSTQETARKDLGDGPWGLGCTAYERACFALVKLAETADWVKIVDPGLEFRFLIGAVPVRFFHGDVDRLPAHCAVVSEVESKQIQQLLGFQRGVAQMIWRVCIETGQDGCAWRVWLVRGRTDREVHDRWLIWNAAGADGMTAPPAGVPLDSPDATHKLYPKRKKAPDTGTEGSGEG